MAQTSAAREPSMEEILASIRRIIESNDEATATPARPQFASLDGGRAGPSELDQPDEESVMAALPASTSDAFPASSSPGRRNDEPSFTTPIDDKAETAAPARAISLADVAARLRGTNGTVAVETHEVGPAASSTMKPQVPEIVDEMPAAVNVPPSDLDSGVADDDDANTVQENVMSDSPVATTTSSEESAEQESPPMGTALMSADSGAKVAAAFGDLNEAVSRGAMRSFDEIAEEMMRPMLRDWLDDNLPTLVEKLVREEIERVARGGRR